jgi:hypothetical protein
MSKAEQSALAALRAKRLRRTPLEEVAYRYGAVVKPWDRRIEDEAPYLPPGFGRACRMPEQPPKGAPYADVTTAFLSRHLAWSMSLAVKKHFLEREHLGLGDPLWEMFGPDKLAPIGDDEPRIYHITASRLYLLTSSGGAERLRDIVHDWMRRVGEDVGCPLRWAAFIHCKPYLHVELIVRGKDEKDALLYFSDPYVERGLRRQLQHALVQVLGTGP